MEKTTPTTVMTAAAMVMRIWRPASALPVSIQNGSVRCRWKTAQSICKVAAKTATATTTSTEGTNQKVVRRASQRQLGSCWRAGGRRRGPPAAGAGVSAARPLGSAVLTADPGANRFVVGAALLDRFTCRILFCRPGFPAHPRARHRSKVPRAVAGCRPVRWRLASSAGRGRYDMPTEQPFGGVIGRTIEMSEPWWPPLPHAPDGRAQRGGGPARRRRVRPVRLLRIGHRHARRSTGWPPTACGTRTSTPPPCARRRGPCLLTGRNHHTNGMGRVVEIGDRVPRLRRHRAQGQRIPVGDPAAQRAMPPSPWASGTWPRRRDGDGRAQGQVAARAGLRALLRLSGRRDRPVPSRPRLRQPPDRPAPDTGRGLPPDRGPGRPGHPVHQGPPGRRPGEALLPVVRPGRLPCPPPGSRRSTSTATGASSTWGGTPGATRCSRARSARACCPRAPVERAPVWVPAWDSLNDDEKRLYARMMEVYAGFLTHTDAQVGRLLDFIEELGELDDTIVLVMSDNGAIGRGWRPRLVQRDVLLQLRAREHGGEPGPDRPAGRARGLQPLSLGVGLGGEHAAASAGSARPTRGGSATR